MAQLEPSVAVPGLTFEPQSATAPLAVASLQPDAQAVLATARQWRVSADPSVVGESGTVCCVRAFGGGTKVACCIPTPVYADRGAAFFAQVWGQLGAVGWAVLAIDWPGQGRAPGPALSAKAARHGDLLVALLTAFGVKDVAVLADAGGGAAFIRAFLREPTLLGAHHVLMNPIISKVSPELMPLLCKHGVDLKICFADGWGPSDNPFTVANCGQIFEFCTHLAPIADTRGPRIDVIILIPPRGMPTALCFRCCIP